MFDSDLATVLLAMLGDPNEGARQSIVISIAHLAKHCKFLRQEPIKIFTRE